MVVCLGGLLKETLAEFSFILAWENLTEAQKLGHLTKKACHELHFFIKMRDPVFFNTHVKPVLSNKKKVVVHSGQTNVD